MNQFAVALEVILLEQRVKVLDRTGLNGAYDFRLAFANPSVGIQGSELPSLFTALEESLGLKMEKTKVPLEVLVIDQIRKVPTEN